MKLSTGCALLDPKAALAKAGLAAGSRYADFGAGTLGHFVFPASVIVGKEGKVWAVDILKGALAGIESRMRLEGTTNVEPVWGDVELPRGTRIPDGAADVVSAVNVAALFRKGRGALAEAARALKRGGTLLLIDWDMAPASFGPPPSARVSAEEVARAVVGPLFAPIASFRAGPHHWGLTFKRL
jgi:ubiquinone/menaquinone biosynthesis C-methylase UbiE